MAANTELAPSSVVTVVPIREHVQSEDLKEHTTIRQLVESLPGLLVLAQNAPIKVVCRRLHEDWEGANPDVVDIVTLQKKLWALVGLRRLNELLSAKRVFHNSSEAQAEEKDEKPAQDEKSIVHISEDVVDSWLHAATSPQHQVSWLRPPRDYTSTLYGTLPRNIDIKPWVKVPTLPYSDSSVDLISSRAIPVLLQSSQWPGFALECARILSPGGIFEVTVLDPLPRNCGPLLQRWTAEKIILGLERRFLVTHPTMIIPVWLDDVAEFEHRDIQTLSFPAAGDGDMCERRLSDWTGAAYPTSTSASQGERHLRGLSVARLTNPCPVGSGAGGG
ncbi:hypothetical protein G647_00804 [Cladophialophora carrionii CBS 160.54]|uniref:Uncharacterized protein n=1 Tax=Cladophialophora carrionii CBS 160.54 TaxID=1279043 RepID=V9DNB1_9EURO|nr:uncharacterized protein G647_00804 [Cladophialophora carrionii CBS 160.54]ETI28355.1 hypothetical protein G647_00804 [Cladophialophora carrionii CBS 160.54]